VDLFFAKYSEWLKRHLPRVWLFNDNDETGRKAFVTTGTKDGVPVPSFTDRLYHLGIEVVVNSQFSSVKDFNDAYKAVPQSFGPEQIYELMQAEELLN
jgi:hypothetical protein